MKARLELARCSDLDGTFEFIQTSASLPFGMGLPFARPMRTPTSDRLGSALPFINSCRRRRFRMTKILLVLLTSLLTIASTVAAQAPRPKLGATVYVQPTDDGF